MGADASQQSTHRPNDVLRQEASARMADATGSRDDAVGKSEELPRLTYEEEKLRIEPSRHPARRRQASWLENAIGNRIARA